MIARNFIETDLPTLKCSDSGDKALDIMENFKVFHLPIVDNKEYVGIISDEMIYDLNLTKYCFNEKGISLISPYVFDNKHVYEVVQIANEFNLSIVPVLNIDQEYVGAISINKLLRKLSGLFAGIDTGAVMVLEVAINDYSLSEIAQIVESNNFKVLSLFTYHNPNSNKLEITLKLNATDISSVIETFVRYEYNLLSVFMDDSKLNDIYHSRYEQFLKYLSI